MFDYWMVIPLVSTLIVQPEKLPGKNAIKIQLAQVENCLGSYITCVEQLAHSQSSRFWHSSTTLGLLQHCAPI